MTPSRKSALVWFWGGVIAFAIVIVLHIPLITVGVPGGISAHQAAPDALTVDVIQQSWEADGLIVMAAIAIVGDLIFIGIYGTGCVLAGLHFRSYDRPRPRVLGYLALFSGAIFLVSDYGETIAQLIQLARMQGDDNLAMLASTLRPIKMSVFVAAFLAVVIAQFLTRKSISDA